MSTRTSIISPHQKYSTPTSNRPHQKYSTDESIGRSKRCPTCSSIIESSTDDSSPATDESSPSSVLSTGEIVSRPYDIVFFLSEWHRPESSDFLEDLKDVVEVYKIKIDPESCLEDESQVLKIRPLWKGLLPHLSTFAALDSRLYCVGGEKVGASSFVPYVYILDTLRPSGWLPLPFLNFPRLEPMSLVLEGNIYILAGTHGSFTDSEPTNRGEVEVYDPRDGRWDVLPDPQIPLGCRFFCATLENPNRILVAPRTEPGKALFCVYDPRQGNWELLDNPVREVHRMCPIGDGGKALSVENTLFWLTDDHTLLAYVLDHGTWLESNLLCFGTFIFGYRDWGLNTLLHLEDQKICMVQSAPGNLIHCVVLDVSPNLIQKRLEISVVSIRKFKTGDTSPNSPIDHCFLLGK